MLTIVIPGRSQFDRWRNADCRTWAMHRPHQSSEISCVSATMALSPSLLFLDDHCTPLVRVNLFELGRIDHSSVLLSSVSQSSCTISEKV
jgi:hypothetical protein